MKVDYHITEKAKRCQLLNMDMTIYKEFGSIRLLLNHLGYGRGTIIYKPKNKPFQMVKHRETKVKYYLKIID